MRNSAFSINASGGQIKTGNVETQSAQKIPNDKNRNISEVPIEGTSYLGVKNGSTEIIRNSSITDLVDKLKDRSALVSTFRGNGVNRIDSPRLLPDVKNDNFLNETRSQYTDYENLTGIEQDAPHIIMLTDFKPIYNLGWRNDIGDFFNNQIEIRQLKKRNINHIIDFNKSVSDKFESMMLKKIANFDSSFSKVGQYITSIKETIYLTDIGKSLFTKNGLLSYSITVNALSEFSERILQSANLRTASVTSNFEDGMTIYKILSKFGFDEGLANSKFLLSKTALQLLLETRNSLKYHSRSLLGLSQDGRKRDDSPTRIFKDPDSISREFNNKLYSSTAVGELSLYRRLDPNPSYSAYVDGENVEYKGAKLPEDVVALLANLETEMSTLGSSGFVFDTSERKVAAFADLLSKEFKLSRILLNSEVQNYLKSKYDYSFTPGLASADLFDHIFGEVGSQVGSIIESTYNGVRYTNPLTLIFQNNMSEGVLLPFEEKPLPSSNINYLLGQEYFFNSSLDVTKARINEFLSKIKVASENFSSTVDMLNLLSADSTTSEFVRENSIQYFDDIFNTLNEIPTIWSNNEIITTSLLSLAKNNNTLKTYLFLYAIVDESNQNLSTFLEQQIDNLSNEMIPKIKESSLQDSLAPGVLDSLMTNGSATVDGKNHILITAEGSVSDSLKNSNLFGEIKKFINISDLREDIGFTFYRSFPSIKVAMGIFEMLLSVVEKVKYQVSLEGRIGGKNSRVFYALTSSNERDSSLFRDTVVSYLRKEISDIQHAIMFLSQTASSVYRKLTSYVVEITNASSLSAFNELKQLIGNDMLFNFVTKNNQHLALMQNQHFSIKEVLNAPSSNGLKLIDEYSINPSLREIVKSFFMIGKLASYEGYNSKIMTVGIPSGMFGRLGAGEAKSSSENLLNVKVYKVDKFYPEIIFKPLSFTFELNRFPVTAESKITKISQDIKTIEELVNLIPTIVYNKDVNNANELQFLNPIKGQSKAFGSNYSFLSEQQKTEIYKNHVVSMFLEYYLKIMTCISTNDSEFSFDGLERGVDADLIELLTNEHISSFISQNSNKPSNVAAQSKKGRLFYEFTTYTENSDANLTSKDVDALSQYTNNATINKAVVNSKQSLTTLGKSQIFPLIHQLGVISEFSRTLSNMSNPEKLIKSIISPKKFDRIFNIVFDVNAFEIDELATRSTSQGNDAMNSLILEGTIVPIQGNLQQNSTTTGRSIINLASPKAGAPQANQASQGYILKPRDRSSDQVFFEKYFTTIETFSTEEA